MIFLDTSFLLALEWKRDQYHRQAKRHWQKLLKAKQTLLTTTFVISEAITFFNARALHQKAVDIGQALLNGSGIDVVFVDKDLFLEGWAFSQDHADKSYSLTDCISFVLMKERSVQRALCFDHHFVQAGLSIEPEINP